MNNTSLDNSPTSAVHCITCALHINCMYGSIKCSFKDNAKVNRRGQILHPSPTQTLKRIFIIFFLKRGHICITELQSISAVHTGGDIDAASKSYSAAAVAAAAGIILRGRKSGLVSAADCSSTSSARCHRLCDLPTYLTMHGLSGIVGGPHWKTASTNVLSALG